MSEKKLDMFSENRETYKYDDESKHRQTGEHTMRKHTPGPWYADKKGLIWRRPPSDLYQNGGGVAGDMAIATAYVGWSGEGLEGYPVNANARLIASAPELLEALKVMIVVFQPRTGEPSPDAHVETVVWDNARQAIAKAEGTL